MLRQKIKAISLWFILKIFLFDKIKAFDINPINQSQKIKNLDENVNIKNPINTNRTRKLQEESYKPIRIFIDNIIMNDTLKREKTTLDLINKALYRAKNTLEKLIKVKREPNGISAADYKQSLEENFGDDYFSSQILTENLLENIDLVIFIDYISSSSSLLTKCNEYPKILRKKNGNQRPIIGSITFAPDKLSSIEESNNDKYTLEFLSSNFLHQFTHILGFTRSVLGNKVGQTKVNRIKKLDMEKEMIIGDNLIRFARKYFNCDEINGLEVEEFSKEDQCKEFIHWDARILLGEYMTAFTYVQEQAISEFTLALLKDTGFYEVNNYTGGLMRFGKNAGCDFFKLDCNERLKPEEIKLGQNTTNKAIFINEFALGL